MVLSCLLFRRVNKSNVNEVGAVVFTRQPHIIFEKSIVLLRRYAEVQDSSTVSGQDVVCAVLAHLSPQERWSLRCVSGVFAVAVRCLEHRVITVRGHIKTLWTDAQTLCHSQRSYPNANFSLLLNEAFSLHETAEAVHQIMQKVGKSFDPLERHCERHCSVRTANV